MPDNAQCFWTGCKRTMQNVGKHFLCGARVMATTNNSVWPKKLALDWSNWALGGPPARRLRHRYTAPAKAWTDGPFLLGAVAGSDNHAPARDKGCRRNSADFHELITFQPFCSGTEALTARARSSSFRIYWKVQVWMRRRRCASSAGCPMLVEGVDLFITTVKRHLHKSLRAMSCLCAKLASAQCDIAKPGQDLLQRLL